MAKYSSVTTTTRQIQTNNDVPAAIPEKTTTETVVEHRCSTCHREPDLGDFLGLGFLVIVAIVGIIGFIFAIRSRKYYKCPVCGESFRAEYMDCSTCKVCGAELNETDDKDVTDKTK